jgi:hypothetical protein
MWIIILCRRFRLPSSSGPEWSPRLRGSHPAAPPPARGDLSRPCSPSRWRRSPAGRPPRDRATPSPSSPTPAWRGRSPRISPSPPNTARARRALRARPRRRAGCSRPRSAPPPPGGGHGPARAPRRGIDGPAVGTRRRQLAGAEPVAAGVGGAPVGAARVGAGGPRRRPAAARRAVRLAARPAPRVRGRGRGAGARAGAGGGALQPRPRPGSAGAGGRGGAGLGGVRARGAPLEVGGGGTGAGTRGRGSAARPAAPRGPPPTRTRTRRRTRRGPCWLASTACSATGHACARPATPRAPPPRWRWRGALGSSLARRGGDASLAWAVAEVHARRASPGRLDGLARAHAEYAAARARYEAGDHPGARPGFEQVAADSAASDALRGWTLLFRGATRVYGGRREAGSATSAPWRPPPTRCARPRWRGAPAGPWAPR